jgi:3-oxoadipate enol-lactonase
MPLVFLPDLRLNAEISGPPSGPPLVLIHALGTDLHIWDEVLPLLPPGLRILRFDLRGHGASDVPPAPYNMGTLIRDTERLMDHFAVTDAVILGLSIGGLIAQGLAVKRLDLIRAMILSNTAARIGRPEQWQARIAAVRATGMESLADATMERWLGRKWRDHAALPALEKPSSPPIPKAGWGAPLPSRARISLKPPPRLPCPPSPSRGPMTAPPRPIFCAKPPPSSGATALP